VAANDALGNSPDFAVPCQMARDATNDGTLDAPLCLSGGRGKRYAQKGDTKDQRLHGDSPKKISRCNNPGCGDWFWKA
jgi:hypothetical protein